MLFEKQENNITDNNSERNNDKVRSYHIQALKLLQEGNAQAAYLIFDKINSIYGCAYCKIMQGDIQSARILLNIIKDSSSAVNWSIVMINLTDDTKGDYPTYLQIRNFYEQDLDMLLKYKQNDIANKIINKNGYLENFNREIYKYSARVLFNYDNIDLSEKLLKKSLDIFYNDPETHFMLGEIYLKQKNIPKAKLAFEVSNEVIGMYGPAFKKLIELEKQDIL